jgi:hypothetical protein
MVVVFVCCRTQVNDNQVFTLDLRGKHRTRGTRGKMDDKERGEMTWREKEGGRKKVRG